MSHPVSACIVGKKSDIMFPNAQRSHQYLHTYRHRISCTISFLCYISHTPIQSVLKRLYLSYYNNVRIFYYSMQTGKSYLQFCRMLSLMMLISCSLLIHRYAKTPATLAPVTYDVRILESEIFSLIIPNDFISLFFGGIM